MPYPGGKLGAGVYHAIINQIPPHRLYVEPFVGGGAILLKKRPAERSVVYDLDAAAIAALRERVPREEREETRRGEGGEGRCGNGKRGESPFSVSPLSPQFDLHVGDGLELLTRTRFDPDTFIYADPPYLQTAVLSKLRYQYILSPAQHRKLLKALKSQRCPVMISGYWSRMYADELQGWRTIQFGSMTRGGYQCEEWLWMNYPDPQESGQLHDYRYVGRNYREREKFRRQQKRWSTRLAKMTNLQRLALMSVLDQAVGKESHAINNS
jgi:DNA adenine methylase